MKKMLLVGLGLLALLFTIGCAAKSVQTANQSGLTAPGSSGRGGTITYTTAAATTKAPSFSQSGPMPTTTQIYSGNAQPVSNLPSDRMVVKTGNIQMVVAQIASALDGINQVAARYGGYVVNSQQWKEGDRNIGSISIRVLAENYDKALTDLRSIAKSITSESTNSQDVTEEYS